MNERNKLYKTFILTLLVVLGLIALNYLPEITLYGDEPLRKVDILADVKKKTYTVSEAEKLIAEAEEERKQLIVEDTIPPGVTPIEDFSYTPADEKDNDRMMDLFYARLADIDSLDRPVRIAYYGDSFIGGDILTGDLRDMLQKKFGGCGVGALDLVQESPRSTVGYLTHGLVAHKPTQRKIPFKAELQAIDNVYSTSEEGAWARFTGVNNKKYGSRLDRWNTSLLYFRPTSTATVSCRVNDDAPKRLYNGTSSSLKMVSAEGDIHSVQWNLTGGGVFYFAANEGKRGVILDNFALVSAPGTQHLSTPQSTLDEFAELRPYDLIIFQYGLNIVSPNDKTGYKVYRNRFAQILDKFHKAWPEAALMIVSVSDRSKGTQNGEAQTMKGIEELVIAQRETAKDSKIAFWNLFSAMGGKGSIAKMAACGEAAKDFTHMSFKGGKKLATKLYDAILCGFDNYQRRQQLNDSINTKVNNIRAITR